MLKLLVTLTLIVCSANLLAQRGHDGSITISTANTVLNTYAKVNGVIDPNTLSITVDDINTLGTVNPGDLLMVVQMQGLMIWDGSVSINPGPASPWNGNNSAIPEPNVGNPNANVEKYGKVNDYGQVGHHELREVRLVVGNEITFTCPLERAYKEFPAFPNLSIFGAVQVIKVPRYENLTVNAPGSIICSNWNGVTGGVIALEVNGDLIINSGATIDASGRGFRGGLVEGQSHQAYAGMTPHTDGPGNGNSFMGSANMQEGAQIGEGILGHKSNNYTHYNIPYGRGAIANGGGGGGLVNAGGGGGSNIGVIGLHTGKGIPRAGYDTYWNTEKPLMSSTFSSGGGRGGYALAESQNYGVNPYVGPNVAGWGGYLRISNGGYGGHALLYNPNRIFMGGGGGAGGQDSGQGGNGGNGGGIIYLSVYGTISGQGQIVSNGANGQHSNPSNQATASNASNSRKGNDGAGGGGGGGSIFIKNMNPIPGTIAINARGGNGGNQNLTIHMVTSPFGNVPLADPEISGPGAGGAGGGVVITSGTPVINVDGGLGGSSMMRYSTNTTYTVNPMVANFPMNGATDGGVGIGNNTTTFFDIDAADATICGSQSTTLTATVTGTLPAGSTVGWYASEFAQSPVATGTTFNTGVINFTTTYYVGVCPGNFRKPVTITVGQAPVIAGTAVVTNATCTSGGSINGLTVSGGEAPYTYSWNGTTTTTPNLANASQGNYTLTVTGANGCSASSNAYTINGTGGPTVAGTPIIVDENCNNLGTINGITATGGVGTLTYTWNGVASTSLNTSGAAGQYTLIVTDGNGCTAQSGPHTIGYTPDPTVAGTAVITNATCNTTGSITGLSGANGSGTYTYSWGTGVTTANYTNAPVGDHTLTITDGNGCSVASGPHTVTMQAVPIIAGTASIQDATCTVAGSITGLTASSGVGTLTYSWSNGVTTLDLPNVAAGSYTLTVSDENGCTATSGPHTVNTIAGPSLGGTVNIVNETCTNGGSITGLTVSGGILPYTYSWNLQPSTTIDLTNAAAGTYALAVSDANGCVVTSGPHVIAPASLPIFGGAVAITNVTCNGSGSITGITVTGGTAPYSYTWNGVASNSVDATDLAAGNYTLEVTDANGCVISSGPHTVGTANIPVINVDNMVVVQPTCVTNGSITGITVTGGVAPYNLEWNETYNPDTDTLELQAGDYVLTVKDAGGCIISSDTISLVNPQLPLINAQNLQVTNATCITTGSINGLTVSNGLAPYTYNWNNGSFSTLNITSAPVGVYNLQVTDANGCVANHGPVNVTQDAGVVANFSYSPNPIFIDEVITFVDQSNGNIVDWTWNVDSVQTTGFNSVQYVFTQEGVYQVSLIVEDANGCIDTLAMTIEVNTDVLVPNVITPNGDDVNDVFVIKGLMKNTQLLILNRWGNVIYSSSNYDNSWNGTTNNGVKVTEGVYTYMITLPDGKQKHGFVHVEH